MALTDDPRADPRMLAAMAPFGMAAAPGLSLVHAGSSLDDALGLYAQAEAGFATVHEILADELPPIERVERSVQTIHVISMNELTRPAMKGLAYYRALLDAGVSASSRTINGTCHSADCLFAARAHGYEK